MELKEEKLKKISGGGAWSIAGIIGGIIFLIGIVDGYVRPLKCK